MISTEKLLEGLQQLLDEGKILGLDMKAFEEKVSSVKQMMGSGKIRIALLGAISDGKTTSIAAFLGKISEDMKIDSDESSDELTIYRPVGLEDKFEFIDTPGLFGTKEREFDGDIVKFSDITLRYLSEANIVIYVCDAKNPLKNSHRPIIYKVMRELNKLPVSLFVINKMDETGCDLMDNEEFADMANVKKATFIRNLSDCLELTEDEKNNLRICCIAADPKRAGLKYWLQRTKDYEARSHIQSLRTEITDMTTQTDTRKVLDNSVIASVREIMNGIDNTLDIVVKPMSDSLKKSEEKCLDMRVDEQNLKNNLIAARRTTIKSIDTYKSGLIADIKSASLETFEDVLSSEVGIGKDGLSFSVVEREINNKFCLLGKNVQAITNAAAVEFERKFKDQEQFLADAAGKGVKLLKNVKISGEQVKATRDLLFKSFKFKPWGAIKMAAKITKAIGWAAVGLGLAIDAYQWWKKKKAIEGMEKAKKDILNVIDEIFDNVNAALSDAEFFKTFGEGYLSILKQLEEREFQIKELQKQVDQLNDYKQSVRDFWKNNAQEVEYEEIN